ncbi:MAG: chromosome segregation protein SMC [Candidatus Omnitrophica bacterium]|nr:chromosome segregation protein SMC [Candidatus Omnitrophota bacterium]
MYLKKIELFGFKSFAEKTEIVFERGVTCIVGPNGCGKSNISDAIRWVLGERSAKLLRGSRMEDVIFSGTDFRKPLNLSEVSLTIDNSDQKLPLQYEEVVITRRLHRSGESEYLINKTPCRLKDIQDLILDTGVGSNSYSMIEQGRIDYILNAEAEERRFLIEEAAGISKYKVKKEEAIRKLGHTEENLIRLNDIVTEIERNIRYAERQAQRAERYKEQYEKLKNLEIQKALFETHQLDAELKRIHLDRQEQETTFNRLEEEISQQNRSTRQLEEDLQTLEQTFFEQETARSETKQALSSLESQEAFHREKIEFLKLNSQNALGEIELLSKRLGALQLDLEQKTKEQEELRTTTDQLQIERKDLKGALEAVRNGDEAEANKLSDLQPLLFDLARQIAEVKNLLHENHVELITLEQKQLNAKDAQAKLVETKRLLAKQEGDEARNFSNYDEKRGETRLRLNELLAKKGVLDRSLKEAREKLTDIHSRKAELQNQFALLEELNQVQGPDPKKIVAEHSSHLASSGVIKALLDLIDIQPGYELAAEAALADSVKGVVAENVETAVALFERLKKSGSHRATIFIKDLAVLNGALIKDAEAEAHPLIERRLWEAIRVRDGYEAIFGNLIGKFYVIDEVSTESIAQLSKLAGRVKLVSKSGVIFGPEFQITLRNGGYTPERSTLARTREMERLSSDIKIETGESQQLRYTIQEHELSLLRLQEIEKQINDELMGTQAALERIQGASLSLTKYLRQIDEELELTDKEKSHYQIEVERLGSQREDLNLRLKDLQEKESKAQSYFDQYKNRREVMEHDLSILESKLQMQLERKDTLKRSSEFLIQQVNELRERINFLTAQQQSSSQQITQWDIELEGFYGKKENLSKVLMDYSAGVEKTKAARSTAISKRNQALSDLQNSIRNLESVKQKVHECSLKQMELNHRKSSIDQDLQSRYKITLSSVNPEAYQFAEDKQEEVRQEIERLREKLDAFGPVNLLAIEEYQEMKSRHEFMLHQKKDLIEARDSLLEAIRKINRTTRKLFEETLLRVRESFQEYFRTLFGGGQADLILLDEENLFESGLDIVARPPGKKLQHITLLSGGEKALTAIALLLALFSVKPSPFCVLDEIDAPLDEANNERFLHALRPFLATTQFIIVTHTRKTIATGDVLYGVTMQEPGVSKIVAVRLSHEKDTIEHSDPQLATELNQILN